MNALKNSKFHFNKFILTILFVGIFSFANLANAYTYSGVLQLGSNGSQVVSLQQKLGVNPATGDFDYTTRGAVVNFQIAKGLTADGVVGPATGRALTDIVKSVPTQAPPISNSYPQQGSNSSSYPYGCTSSLGFSVSTGKSCSAINSSLPIGCTSAEYYSFSSVSGLPCVDHSTYPAGCTSGTAGYSITTGLSCTIPIGCTSHNGYSIATGLSCDGTSFYTPLPLGCVSREGYSATTGSSCLTGIKTDPLVGNDGTLDNFSKAPGYTYTLNIPSNSTNNILAGYVLTGEEYSDIRITSMTIDLTLSSGDASGNLNKYIKNIDITENGTKVGTVNISDFSKNGSDYSVRIPLTGAILRSNQETYFYITADTLENINSSNINNVWTATVTEVRYMDGSGDTNSTDSKGDIGTESSINFHFLPTS